MSLSHRSKVLIINAYFDPWRSATPTRLFIPRAMAPYYLAGHFNPNCVEVRVYDEVHHGALLNRGLLAWPDVVIFTGLTNAFDRARQLSAYIRHERPNSIHIIGGPIARALPQLCQRMFDYVLLGDVEEIESAIDDILGTDHRAETVYPRYDLLGYSFGLGYVETTRNCNFSCSFCSLTGEDRAYESYSDDWLNRQLDAVGKVKMLMVLDNNFYGNNRSDFKRRVAILGERHRRGQFDGWGCLVTGDALRNEENIALMAANGCLAIFSGVESVDPSVLKTFNKRQSLTSDPQGMATACAEHGILFDYGMILDFTQQTIAEVNAQIEVILAEWDAPVPGLFSLTIPILGTPYFDQAANDERLLPNLLLSDLDGQKIVEWPREPLEQVQAFVRDIMSFRGHKTALLRHTLRRTLRRRQEYRLELLALTLLRPIHRYFGTFGIGSPRQMWQTFREPPLTFCSQSDTLRTAYRPFYRLPNHFANAFTPTLVTDEKGKLSDEIRMGMGK